MSVLKMYFASNNVVVSTEGQFTDAITFTLRADLEEVQAVRLYAECDTGYQATEVNVTIQGTGADKWKLASDNAGTPGTYSIDPVGLGTVGAGSGNRKYFWAQASVLNSEEIGVDNTVTLKLEGIGAAI